MLSSVPDIWITEYISDMFSNLYLSDVSQLLQSDAGKQLTNQCPAGGIKNTLVFLPNRLLAVLFNPWNAKSECEKVWMKVMQLCRSNYRNNSLLICFFKEVTCSYSNHYHNFCLQKMRKDGYTSRHPQRITFIITNRFDCKTNCIEYDCTARDWGYWPQHFTNTSNPSISLCLYRIVSQ